MSPLPARLRRPALALLGLLAAWAGNLLPAQPTLPNQHGTAPPVPRAPATTPPSADRGGYWQQRADYSVVAQLIESRGVVRASGQLRYVNASPDTLRELWLHQHLNAFRPGSRWSADDDAKGIVRFQHLEDPAYGYERFTARPRVGNRSVRPDYPLAPDSTVVRLALPRPLGPGDSLTVTLAWEARPSTVPRRQARKGRHYDFAQWFPKIAVYDRQGWKPNAFVAQGELYGEFGTFDVTFLLPQDQVIAATGVHVSGDPGWERVRLPGTPRPRLAREAYGAPVGLNGPVRVPSGYRAVRFVARDVHHFGWSVSPDYRYEGSQWVRPRSDARGWDTVALHVLHERWEPGRTLRDVRHALQWLEGLFGSYAWPQLTVAERIEGSGTEFPMLVMDGEEDRSLVVHEVGHQFLYGMLANNEWQSAWLDEGFTTYQEMWARGEARVPLALERAERRWADTADVADAEDRRRLALRLRTADDFTAAIEAPIRLPAPSPMGWRSDLFASKDIYDATVYDRAAGFYSALHDLLGDGPFRRFLRSYVAQWSLRHVDRWAMQRAAEDVTGAPLGWFFEQWVHGTGTIDYVLTSPHVEPFGSGNAMAPGTGEWQVTVELERRGLYRHPMPIGVRTPRGWTVVRGNPLDDRQAVRIRVPDRPLEVRLDPFGTVETRTAAASRFLLP